MILQARTSLQSLQPSPGAPEILRRSRTASLLSSANSYRDHPGFIFFRPAIIITLIEHAKKLSLFYDLNTAEPGTERSNIGLAPVAKRLKLHMRRPVIPQLKTPRPNRYQLASLITRRAQAKQAVPHSSRPIDQPETLLTASLHYKLTHHNKPSGAGQFTWPGFCPAPWRQSLRSPRAALRHSAQSAWRRWRVPGCSSACWWRNRTSRPAAPET